MMAAQSWPPVPLLAHSSCSLNLLSCLLSCYMEETIREKKSLPIQTVCISISATKYSRCIGGKVYLFQVWQVTVFTLTSKHVLKICMHWTAMVLEQKWVPSQHCYIDLCAPAHSPSGRLDVKISGGRVFQEHSGRGFQEHGGRGF